MAGERINEGKMNWIPFGEIRPPPASLLKQIWQDSDPKRLIQRTPASYLCPSAVSIAASDEVKSGNGWRRDSVGRFIHTSEEHGSLDSVGFILTTDEQFSVVVGVSEFLYKSKSDPVASDDPDPLKGKKIVVSIADDLVSEPHILKSDIATVLNFDSHYGLVFLKYDNSRRRKKPAKLGSFDAILQSESKTVICLDFHSTASQFVPRLYDLITHDKVVCSCTYGHEENRRYPYFHVKVFNPYLAAVVLDHDAQIVGFRVGACKSNTELSHIMPIDHIPFPHHDILYPVASETSQPSIISSPGKSRSDRLSEEGLPPPRAEGSVPFHPYVFVAPPGAPQCFPPQPGNPIPLAGYFYPEYMSTLTPDPVQSAMLTMMSMSLQMQNNDHAHRQTDFRFSDTSVSSSVGGFGGDVVDARQGDDDDKDAS